MNPFWNQRAVDGLFQNLAAGSFRPAGYAEVALFVGLILLAAAVFWWSGRTLTLRIKKNQSERSARMRAAAVSDLGLAPSDRLLAEKLMEALPDQELQGHTVLLREPVFRATRRALLAQKPLTAFALTALSARLGFAPRRPGLLLENSAEIPAGTKLFVDDDFLRVVRSAPEGVWVELGRGERPLGTPLSLTIHRPEGLYHYNTTAIQAQGDLRLLQHAPDLEREQRRRDYRYAILSPVMVDGRPAQTVDVSAGGLRFRGGGGPYQIGQRLKLQFPGLLAEGNELHAHVVDAPSGGARVSFEPGQDGRCDALLRSVLRAIRESPPDADGVFA